ncbi:hypothetical protein GOP47_0001146 [Adiantum capillus-veneris]|uniref:Uncharacterized protein n=1 Tax=Adiantum capillus-veneris TaxID=13818 RepID=A0A9D4VCT5_ADICA|nr:hypothetical protein GOP47_0000047 [Adiantum capillus-veneris]KAI5084977.1 hypothetical protein GOP47_0001146 [Adiantum capillus-veneris]
MAARLCSEAVRSSSVLSRSQHPLCQLFVLGRGERAFSTDNSYSGQQMRIERLWREFYLGSNHWRTKEGLDELLWIEDGGTHAIKKGQQYPLPGTQQLNGPPPGAATTPTRIGYY